MIAGEGSQPQIINILLTSSSVGNRFTIQMQRNKYNLKMYCRVQRRPQPAPSPPPPSRCFHSRCKVKVWKAQRDTPTRHSSLLRSVCASQIPPIVREASITGVLSAWGPRSLSCRLKHVSSKVPCTQKNELVNLRPTHSPTCTPSQAQTTLKRGNISQTSGLWQCL